MAYTKTVWKNGGPPAISAEMLNKIEQGIEDAHSRINNVIFGDGMDGTAIISANTTLTRDMYYENLTINSGVTLKTNGYKLFVKGTLVNNGTIDNSGENGAHGGTYAGAGVGGKAGVGGGAGGSSTASGGVQGGQASIGGGGGKAGGRVYNGSASTNSDTEQPSVPFSSTKHRPLLSFIDKCRDFPYGGGAGGNGADSSYQSDVYLLGGGGGGGGGRIHIYASNIVNNGTISANGGNGGNSAGTDSYAAGAGGGGGGGFVLLVYQSFSGNEPIVNGGKAGVNSTGRSELSGTDGTAGYVQKLQVS